MRRNAWQVKARITWAKQRRTVRLDLNADEQRLLAEEIGIVRKKGNVDVLENIAGMTLYVGQFLKVRGGKERRYLKHHSQGGIHAHR